MIPWDTPFDLPRSTPLGQSFARRAVAYSLDTLCFLGSFFFGLLFFEFASWVVLAVIYPNRVPVMQSNAADQYLSLWVTVLFIIYFILFEWLFGATPGKLLLGLRVVTERGEPCGFVAAFLRGLMRLIDGLFLCIPAYVSMSTSDLRQRLGDKAAGTVVAHKSDPQITRSRSVWLFLLAAALFLFLITVFSLYYVLVGMTLETTQPSV